MKRISSISIFCILLLAFALHASASVSSNVFSSGFANSGYVPDNNPSGWTDTRTLSGYTGGSALVEDVQVTLNIVGGWNGDLYGYLVHSSGFVVLLDRVGNSTFSPYGYGEAGFTGVTLADNVAHTSIESYGGSSSAAAALSGGTYNSQNGTLNTAFDGLAVNGTWTLFLADLSSGDISQVTGWTLTIDAVPEPTTWAMLIFGAAFGCWRLARRQTKRG